MKAVRKGFTLVELLIVIAVLGSLSGMMMYSSSGAVDAADASKILSNLQSLKMAAMQMYIDEPKVASKTAMAFGADEKVDTANDATDARKVAEVLGSYLGKKADALTSNGAAIVIVTDATTNVTSWYVVYALDANDSAGVKSKLKDKAEDTDLYGSTTAVASLASDSFADYYTNDEDTTCIALKVR